MTDRFAIYLVWGIGTILVYAVVLVRRWLRFQRHRYDRRKAVRRDVRKDVMAGAGLFLTALGSGLAVAFVLFGEPGSGPRSFMIALALGAFTGAGLVMVSEEDANGEPVG